MPALVILAGIAAACDDSVERAVSPDSVRRLVTTVSDENAEATDADETAGFIEQPVLEQVLPPAERVYFTQGGDVWRAPVDGEPLPVTRDEPVIDFSASANGNRVAILRIERDAGGGAERAMPSIRLPDGETLIDLTALRADFDIDQLSPIESLAMAPVGDQLAMTHRDGSVSLVTIAGDVEQVLEPGDGRPGRLDWSSDGRFLAYLDPWLPNEPSALYLLIPERGIRQVLVQPSQGGYGVVQASWIPGTSKIVYIKASESTIPNGGDVFVVDATTGERQLLLSSSEIAPVAGAVDLAVSPDGETVGITGFAPGNEYPTFSGIWLFTLPGGDHYELTVDFDGVVTDLWWLGERLMFRSIDEPRTALPGTYTGQEAFTLYTYDPRTGGLEERYTAGDEDAGSDESDDLDDGEADDDEQLDSLPGGPGIVER